MTLGLSELSNIFTVDPTTGLVSKKKTRRVVGYVANTGYVVVAAIIDGKRKVFLAHRLIWLFVHGDWPKETIDHADLNRTNNAITNLREASYAENNVNRPAIRNGLKGATFDKRTKRFVAQINVEGKNKFLGRFYTEELARAAYMAAARKIYGGFARA